jgi:hypothetical protein
MAANGTWVLDIAKSDYGRGTPSKSNRLVYANTSTSMAWSQEIVSADGRTSKLSYVGVLGNFAPITGDSDGNSMAYLDVGTYAIKNKAGRVGVYFVTLVFRKSP